MSDLKVTTQLLREAAASMSQLHDEFGRLAQRHERVRDIWGSDDVADALHDFAGNWDDNRQKIQNSMTSLRKMAEATAEEFERIESELSCAVEP